MPNTQLSNQTPVASTDPNKIPYRLSLSLDTEAKRELDALKKKTRKSTLVDVLRAALAIYKVVVDHQDAGGRVVFRNADNSEETLRLL
jgi:hypothetical protein